MLTVLVIIGTVILLPTAYMIWRFKSGEEFVAGGSDGKQIRSPRRRR
jgi:hypothetical protein